MNNFDIKKYLVENKLTPKSKLNENKFSKEYGVKLPYADKYEYNKTTDDPKTLHDLLKSVNKNNKTSYAFIDPELEDKDLEVWKSYMKTINVSENELNENAPGKYTMDNINVSLMNPSGNFINMDDNNQTVRVQFGMDNKKMVFDAPLSLKNQTPMFQNIPKLEREVWAAITKEFRELDAKLPGIIGNVINNYNPGLSENEINENISDLVVKWTPEYDKATKKYGDEAYDEKGLADGFKMRDGKKVKEIIGYYVPEDAKNPNDEEFDIIGYIYSVSGKDIESYSEDELDDAFTNALKK